MSATISGPVVSVVMPVFNGETYLRESVGSILKQTYSNFEFIILNDGSTDATSSILKTYRDQRIRLIERDHKGFASSLNEAINLSHGEFIARMDADDISSENRLQIQYDFMQLNPCIDILGGQAEMIDVHGNHLGDFPIQPLTNRLINKYLKYSPALAHPTYFVRKNVYKVLEGYRDLTPAEDYDFLLRAFEKGFKMRNLNEVVLKFRKNPDGMTLSNLQRSYFLSHHIRKMHKRRMKKKIDENKILEYLKNYNKKSSYLFNSVFKSRDILLKIRRGSPNFFSDLIIFGIVFVSLFHYLIFINSYNNYKLKKLNESM